MKGFHLYGLVAGLLLGGDFLCLFVEIRVSTPLEITLTCGIPFEWFFEMKVCSLAIYLRVQFCKNCAHGIEFV